jgi:hypothetical protein
MSRYSLFGDCVAGITLLTIAGGWGWMIYTFSYNAVKIEQRKLAMEERKLQHEQSRDHRPHSIIPLLLKKLSTTEEDLNAKVEQANELELRVLYSSTTSEKATCKSCSDSDGEEEQKLREWLRD